jgi:hypothetical protein
MTACMRFSKVEILETFKREDKSYRLGLLCTHWIRNIQGYKPNAATLARGLTMQTEENLVSNGDLATALDDPRARELLSSDFLLTYLHTLIRAPLELLTDYCEDFDRAQSDRRLLKELKSMRWHGVASIVRNAVSHNFRIELGKFRGRTPIAWRNILITEEMDGQPITSEIFWHRSGYELFLEMRSFAEALPEIGMGR